MTQAEQHAALLDYLEAHRDEWAAYIALPQRERDAMLARVQLVENARGLRAAYDLRRELGVPIRPYGLCDIPSVGDTRCVQDDEAWTGEAGRRLGVSEAQVEELLRPMAGWIIDGHETSPWEREAWVDIRLGFMLAGVIALYLKVRRRPNAPPSSSMVRWTVTGLSVACCGLFVFLFWLAGRGH